MKFERGFCARLPDEKKCFEESVDFLNGKNIVWNLSKVEPVEESDLMELYTCKKTKKRPVLVVLLGCFGEVY